MYDTSHVYVMTRYLYVNYTMFVWLKTDHLAPDHFVKRGALATLERVGYNEKNKA